MAVWKHVDIGSSCSSHAILLQLLLSHAIDGMNFYLFWDVSRLAMLGLGLHDYIKVSNLAVLYPLLYHSDQVFSHASQVAMNWALEVFHHASQAIVNTWLGWFFHNLIPQLPIQVENEQFWHLSQQIFSYELCWIVFMSVTCHTLWTLGRNSTVHGMTIFNWSLKQNIQSAGSLVHHTICGPGTWTSSSISTFNSLAPTMSHVWHFHRWLVTTGLSGHQVCHVGFCCIFLLLLVCERM